MTNREQTVLEAVTSIADHFALAIGGTYRYDPETRSISQPDRGYVVANSTLSHKVPLGPHCARQLTDAIRSLIALESNVGIWLDVDQAAYLVEPVLVLEDRTGALAQGQLWDQRFIFSLEDKVSIPVPSPALAKLAV